MKQRLAWNSGEQRVSWNTEWSVRLHIWLATVSRQTLFEKINVLRKTPVLGGPYPPPPHRKILE